jgi:hypothetical protein
MLEVVVLDELVICSRSVPCRLAARAELVCAFEHTGGDAMLSAAALASPSALEYRDGAARRELRSSPATASLVDERSSEK